MKKILIAALCVGLFVTANSVWAQKNNKVQPKAKVENAEKKTTVTTEATKVCCADKKACCADKKACCAAKAGDKKGACVNVDKKAATCCANKVVPIENKSSGKK